MSTGIRIMYTEGVDAVVSLRDETKEGTSMLKRVGALATVWQLISQNWIGFPEKKALMTAVHLDLQLSIVLRVTLLHL